MKSIKINKTSKNYLNQLIENYPNLSSGRKNYEDFEKRILKNILLTKLMIKNNNLDSFNKSKPSFIFTNKIAKIIYK
tara:strand:- start:5672 stop:5902 length:231 start_codon:yes stop_codon:yes gene_type:complete